MTFKDIERSFREALHGALGIESTAEAIAKTRDIIVSVLAPALVEGGNALIGKYVPDALKAEAKSELDAWILSAGEDIKDDGKLNNSKSPAPDGSNDNPTPLPPPSETAPVDPAPQTEPAAEEPAGS